MNRAACLVAATLIALALPHAAPAQVRATDAWVRGTVQGQVATGAFMNLVSASETALVGATSPVAGTVEIHQMTIDGGVMKMRAMPRVPLAANRPLELKPGGYHLMLMALKQPLPPEANVPITLTFEDATGKRTQLEVTATVRPLGAAPAKHGH